MNLRMSWLVGVLLLLGSIATGNCGLFDAVSSIVSSIGETVKDQTFCRLTECCNDRSVPIRLWELKQRLQSNLHGQHIVIERLIPALHAHLTTAHQSRKPLVLSFQGPTGTGKNYVAQIIAETLYTLGLKSKFVRYYRGRADFPLASEVHNYNARINSEVHMSLAACQYSLFIFDEVDNMPEGIFKALTSLMDYSTHIGGYDSSKAIVILLSNNGGEHISNRLGNMLKDGTLREETKMLDFEQILKKAAYNLDGGMKKSSLIEAYVIDHYLPFLPLEKKHVVSCIVDEFNYKRMMATDKAIDFVVEETVEYDPTHGIFVVSGCKSIAPKVAWYVYSHRQTEL